MSEDQSRFVVNTAEGGLDISGEVYRKYTFPGGHEVLVTDPKTLWVKVSKDPAMAGKHSHRIERANGNGVYIPAGWIAIEWANKAGEPAVKF